MADLAASAVTLINSWYEGGMGSRRTAYYNLILTLTGQGDDTDDIKAGVLGLSKIEGCSPLQADDNSAAYWAAPSYDGTKLFLYEDGSDAPAVQTGTFKCIVWGQ